MKPLTPCSKAAGKGTIKCRSIKGAHKSRADRGKAPSNVTWSTLETEDAGLARHIRELARGWGYCDSDESRGTGEIPHICEIQMPPPTGARAPSARPTGD